MASITTAAAPSASTTLAVKKPSVNASLLETGYFSDLTVHCGKREWHLHRSVVCTQSKFFMKACTGDFEEAKNRRINLSADDPDLLDAMIKVLYTEDYAEPRNIADAFPEGDVDEEPDALFHVRLNILADKYDINTLVQTTTSRFQYLAETNWHKPCFAEWVHAVHTMDIPNNSFAEIIRTVMATHFLHIAQPTEHNQALQQAGGAAFGFEVAQKFLAARTWRCGQGCGANFTMHSDNTAQMYLTRGRSSPSCPCCGSNTVKAQGASSQKATVAEDSEWAWQLDTWT